MDTKKIVMNEDQAKLISNYFQILIGKTFTNNKKTTEVQVSDVVPINFWTNPVIWDCFVFFTPNIHNNIANLRGILLKDFLKEFLGNNNIEVVFNKIQFANQIKTNVLSNWGISLANFRILNSDLFEIKKPILDLNSDNKRFHKFIEVFLDNQFYGFIISTYSYPINKVYGETPDDSYLEYEDCFLLTICKNRLNPVILLESPTLSCKYLPDGFTIINGKIIMETSSYFSFDESNGRESIILEFLVFNISFNKLTPFLFDVPVENFESLLFKLSEGPCIPYDLRFSFTFNGKCQNIDITLTNEFKDYSKEEYFDLNLSKHEKCNAFYLK